VLLEDQPEGPTWAEEIIDQALRLGYLGCRIDEWFQLRPMYR
jgi:hypothetical protein